MKAMELLAPAGNMEALRAAVAGGADAVYLGLREHNARAMAQNFTWEEMQAALDLCHLHGLRVYVTMNTLLRGEALPGVLEACERLHALGADALILQDIGLLAALRAQGYPGALHASTQMTLHNAQGAAWAKAQGLSRVVLAREMPIADMAGIAAQGVEVEVFVHGALCVSVSGQCYFSGMVGGGARSANCGGCAQPCRLPYTANLETRDSFLLSTRDLCLLPRLPALAEAGVASLKIEGRLKPPEYVYTVTSVYREALDALQAGEAFDIEEALPRLHRVFQRGFTQGYQRDFFDADILAQDMPNNRGERIGRAVSRGKSAELALPFPLHAGDIVQARGDYTSTHRIEREMDKGDILALSPQAAGEDIYRVAFGKTGPIPERTIRLRGQAILHENRPFTIILGDERHQVTVEGALPQKARKAPLLEENLRKQLDKTGDTPYRVRWDIDLEDGLFLPVSALNALRREALDALAAARIAERRVQRSRRTPVPLPKAAQYSGDPLLIAQASDLDLLEALQSDADVLYYAPRDWTRPDALSADYPLVLPPFIDSETLEAIALWARKTRAQLIVSNPAQLGLPGVLATDYPLHALNAQAGAYLAESARRVTVSVEATAQQTARLLGEGGAWEIVAYGHLPLMLLRHCPLLALRPYAPAHAKCTACDSCANELALVDRKGYTLELCGYRLGSGCMLTPMNAVPRNMIKDIPPLLRHRPAALRAIFTRESAGDARKILSEIRGAMRQ